jgi:hypothetical protein
MRQDADDDDVPHWERAKKAPVAKPEPVKRKPLVPLVTAIVPTLAPTITPITPAITSYQEELSVPKPHVSVATRASVNRGRVSLNLSHLSTMQQAVVMAEILGAPKALQ